MKNQKKNNKSFYQISVLLNCIGICLANNGQIKTLDSPYFYSIRQMFNSIYTHKTRKKKQICKHGQKNTIFLFGRKLELSGAGEIFLRNPPKRHKLIESK